MKEAQIFEKNIGEHRVYNEQARCANKILDVFNRHGGPPLLVAQMQQGKTGVCICVVDQFIKYCEVKGKKYEIIYVINISDNELKNQTRRRLRKAGLLSKVQLLHHCDLKGGNYIPDKTVDIRLIIVDECHIALEKSSDDNLKPFHEFLKNCGIVYGQSIDCWENKDNYVLSVSATPYAHIIKEKINQKAFESVVLEVNEEYYSLQRMKQDNRIRQSRSVVKDGRVTEFFIERMQEFLKSCKENGSGHMVVRAVGESPSIIEQFIKDKYPQVDVQIFGSLPVNNIGTLDDTLSDKLPKPFVAIIRGSLRAGKTLTTTENIRMWIEPPSSKTDAMCQVVGRCLGNPEEGTQRSKFDDKFPVYCNMKELDYAIEFYNDLNCVPSGIRNKSTNENIKYEMRIAETFDQIPAEAFWPGRKNGEPWNGEGSRISKQEGNDLADDVLKLNQRGNNWIIFIDGPHHENPKHQESWDKLMEQHEDWQGCYAYYVLVETKQIVYDGKLDDDCILT